MDHMDQYGIESAMVSHAVARELDPIAGNQMLMDEIADAPRLSPIWVLLPHHTREFPAPDELIAQMKAQNVRMATMFASTANYYFSLSEWNCGELYTALEAHQIPLLLAMGEFDPNLEGLYAILEKHPNLPLILTNVTYRVSRNLYPLMKRFPRLYVETFGFKGQDGIADLCEVFGAERMIFGSGMPVACGASAVAMITYSTISDSDKQKIASENLEALLGGVSL